MQKALRLLVLSALILVPGISNAAVERFDGNWQTKLTCPPKGNTEGYTWQFLSVIQNSNLRGEHGTAREKGYLLLEGQIKDDGSAKLSASGIVTSRKYARGVFAHGARTTATTSRLSSKMQRAQASRAKALASSVVRAHSSL
jgi:hypothetical protein